MLVRRNVHEMHRRVVLSGPLRRVVRELRVFLAYVFERLAGDLRCAHDHVGESAHLLRRVFATAREAEQHVGRLAQRSARRIGYPRSHGVKRVARQSSIVASQHQCSIEALDVFGALHGRIAERSESREHQPDRQARSAQRRTKRVRALAEHEQRATEIFPATLRRLVRQHQQFPARCCCFKVEAVRSVPAAIQRGLCGFDLVDIGLRRVGYAQLGSTQLHQLRAGFASLIGLLLKRREPRFCRACRLIERVDGGLPLILERFTRCIDRTG
ncbi:hypothetical protein VSR34_00980 [Paraburkholderia sp. JHI2823]|uniref:hypothetical protein n=1 Tax=Paraburkholderia sp. JHI2823 TaxID=3112960 RepID=UPI00317ECDC0